MRRFPEGFQVRVNGRTQLNWRFGIRRGVQLAVVVVTWLGLSPSFASQTIRVGKGSAKTDPAKTDPAKTDSAKVDARSAEAFFENEIRPLLHDRCIKCHGSRKQESGLRLDGRQRVLQGGDSGPAAVSGRPGESLLMRVVRRGGDVKMPPREPLDPREVDALERWVRLGLPWSPAGSGSGDSGVFLSFRSGAISDRERRFWSFQPIVRPEPPKVKDRDGWARTVMDRFILAGLEQRGLSPVSDASKRTLLRRVTFDLIGLPPTPEETRDYVDDGSSGAFERVVDRLLRSRHYGERWGRHWLDVVRYADTAGETADYPTTQSWRYRNWVIDAFNRDKPYDEFVREQVAGDILAGSAPREQYGELMTATGFLAVSRRFGFGVEAEQFLTIQDTIDTMGQAVLGLTLGCARCHDHKFDPINAADYYAWYGIFDSSSYSLSGDEKTKKERRLYPGVPSEEVDALEARHAASLGKLDAQVKKLEAERKDLEAMMSTVARGDPGFESQELDMRPGAPWSAHENARIVASAQSPFRNVFPEGSRGIEFPQTDENNHFGKQLRPPRTPVSAPRIFFNIDFRNLPQENASDGKGAYRLYLGRGPGNSAAVEMGATATSFSIRDGDAYRPVRKLDPGRWYSLQVVLDLRTKTYSGSVGHPGDVTRFEKAAFTIGWDGTIDQFFVDRYGPVPGVSPARQFDNFALRATEFLPVDRIAEDDGQTLHPDRLERYLGKRRLHVPVKNDGGNQGFHVWRRVEPLPTVGMNVTDGTLTVPGTVPPGRVAVHPAQKKGAAILWRSPLDGRVRISGKTSDAHDCGNGIEWFIDHLSARGLTSLAEGAVGRDGEQIFEAVSGGKLDDVEVRAGDCVQLVISPRGDYGCDLTLVDLRIEEIEGERAWDLVADVAGRFHASNPQADRLGNAEIWSFLAVSPDRAQSFASSGAFSISVSEIPTKRRRVAELAAKLEMLRPRRDALGVSGAYPRIYGVVEKESPADVKIHLRGDPEKLGRVVARRNLEILGSDALESPKTTSGRLDLARWLTRPENPLTARVMVNRIWQYHFGPGLVETANDFGTRGRRPSHPALLDWLAAEFVENGWSIKYMHRLILRSRVYQLASSPSSSHGARGWLPPREEIERTRLFGRFSRRRLEAEALRDAMLAISGRLDRTPGGPHPFPPAEKWGYSQHAPFYAMYPTDRRSVYLMTQRLKRHPFLALFDGADTNASTARRTETTTPTQALFLLNNEFVHQQAAAFATRLLEAVPKDEDRVRLAYDCALGRLAPARDIDRSLRFLARYRERLGAAGVPESTREADAWAAFARTLLVRNEFLFVE